MMSTVETAREGGADYLQFGKRSDSKLLRTDKDEVHILYGNIEHIRNAEKYCMLNKNWKANYETIVVAFDEKDMAILDRLSGSEKNQMYKNIALDYIKHRTSGYSLENEVIAYSEAHEPKVKWENGKIRKSHLHIQINYLNPMTDTRIRTTYFNNAFMSDVMDKWIAKKNGLTYIKKIDPNRKKPKPIQKAIDENQTISFRKKLIKDSEKVNTKEQFEDYCKKNKLKIDVKETYYKNGKVKNHYIKLVKEDNSTLNLRQFEFNKIKEFYGIKPSKSKQKMIDEINSKSKEELGAILGDYYKDRIKMIDSRRSKSHRANLEKIIDDDLKYDKNIINNNETVKSIKNLSFQEKLFYQTYQKNIKDFDFKGYFIDSKNETTKFTNNQKNIKIEDKGNEITSNTVSDSLQEEVRLMLKIAEAKGWSLDEINIEGGDDFVKEAEKQIANRLKEIQKSQKKEVPKIPDYQKERPNSEIQNYKKDFVEKQYKKEANTNQDLQKIKTDLNAKVILDYAVKKYKLDIKNFNITDDNKIDSLNNKAKPKNIIDFLQKEANLSTKEAIEICQDLYKKDENRNTHSKGVEKESELSNEDLVNNSKVLKKNRRLETLRKYNFHLVQTNKIPIKKEEEVKHHSKNRNKKR